jgi:hypothetical protein
MMRKELTAFKGSFARRSLGLGLAVIGGLLAGACSSSSSGESNAFVGAWLCSDTRTVGSDPSAAPAALTGSVSVTTATTDSMTAVLTVDKVLSACSLRFSSTGNSASLMTGQSCTAATADGTSFAFKSGTATVNANNLLVNLAFDMSPTTAAAGGTDSIGCQRNVPSGPVTGGGW